MVFEVRVLCANERGLQGKLPAGSQSACALYMSFQLLMAFFVPRLPDLYLVCTVILILWVSSHQIFVMSFFLSPPKLLYVLLAFETLPLLLNMTTAIFNFFLNVLRDVFSIFLLNKICI